MRNFSARVLVNIDLFAEQCMDLGQRYIGRNKDGPVQVFLLRRTPSLISRHPRHPQIADSD